jgi:hypothetical protein
MDPTDQREYIIGYRDCCGKEGCYRTLCYNNKDSLPTYRITAVPSSGASVRTADGRSTAPRR